MLDTADVQRCQRMIGLIRTLSEGELLRLLLPGRVEDSVTLRILSRCSFDHAALVVFPDDISDVTRLLAEAGLAVVAEVPSVVVRKRLANRFRVDEEGLTVSILHARIETEPGVHRQFEVFVSPSRTTPGLADLIETEREREHESHLVFAVPHPSDAVLSVLRDVVSSCGLEPDGGGFNPHDSAASGGRSVLYFRNVQASPSPSGLHRLELVCAGHFPTAIDAHNQQTRLARGSQLVRD